MPCVEGGGRSMGDIQSVAAEIRRGKEKEEEDR